VLVVGLDPGGARAFGWAVLSGSFDAPQVVSGGVCTGARAAVEAAAQHLDMDPVAVGIDAPLFWTDAGDRLADSIVRRLVCKAGGRGGTVSHVNSLQGACLVEGAIAARLAHDRWPTAQITEAHPKAMLAVSAEVKAFSSLPSIQGEGHHLRDAALGALAALAMLQRRHNWHNLAPLEPTALHPLGVKVAYWFPQT
jgi:hypothetical protein